MNEDISRYTIYNHGPLLASIVLCGP